MSGPRESVWQMLWMKLMKQFYPKRFTIAQERGRSAEKAAEKFLRNKNWQFVARNWQFHPDEVDLIFHDGQALVFVEVRARQQDGWVRGFDSLGPRKRRALKRASQHYLRGLSNSPETWRWDFIEVDLSLRGDLLDLRHYENITI